MKKTVHKYKGGPWPWCLDLGLGNRRNPLYSLYYDEQAGSGLLIDTPAIDAKGRFLWCTKAKKLRHVHEKVVKKLARLGITTQMTGRIHVGAALKCLDSDTDDTRGWEALALLNIVLDYLYFLPNDAEDQKTIRLLEDLSCHIFEGKDLPLFYVSHDTNTRHVRQLILYSLYRIFENSRIL